LQRKRAEAIEALTKIEIQFAQVRDVLYLERLEEIEEERSGIETGSSIFPSFLSVIPSSCADTNALAGTHPELLHLTQLIELRRDNKLHLARQWLSGLETAYQQQLEHNEHAAWNRWQDERARLRVRMLEEANGKRRRLEREKRGLDRPKDGAFSPRDLSFPAQSSQIPGTEQTPSLTSSPLEQLPPFPFTTAVD
jgi:hypothetical protein